MAYDASLAARVRAIFAAEPANGPVAEKAMFGGLAFLVGGKIAVAASAGSGLLVRVGAAGAEHYLRTTPAKPMDMGGRTMRGWVYVDAQHLRSRRQLGEWVDIGITSAASA